jgi:hypothetical protein
MATTYENVSLNLLDYCDDYIKDYTNNPAVNEKIYGLCADYLLNSLTAKQREYLVNYFSTR